MVGGLGTRLRAVVSDRPKILAPVLNRPFLSYLLDQLIRYQFREAILCCGYMGKSVQDMYGDAYGSLLLAYSWEDTPLGTGGALRNALDIITSDEVLAMNGDSFFDADFGDFYRMHKSKSAEASILLANVPDTSRYGRVTTSNNLVLRFEEKSGVSAPGQINAGVYILNKSILLEIAADRPVSLEKEILPVWAGQRRLRGFESPGRFIDVGTPESYAEAERFFSDGQFT